MYLITYSLLWSARHAREEFSRLTGDPTPFPPLSSTNPPGFEQILSSAVLIQCNKVEFKTIVWQRLVEHASKMLNSPLKFQDFQLSPISLSTIRYFPFLSDCFLNQAHMTQNNYNEYRFSNPEVLDRSTHFSIVFV